MTASIGPSYQLVADDLRSKISSGELQVGDPIPSTVKLMEQYGVSSTVVRHAVAQLRADGVLIGHSGKAVYVNARPEDAAAERLSIEALTELVTGLRDEVRELTQRDEVSELRDTLGRLETQLIDLYGKLGYDYPRDAADAGGKRGRRSGSTAAGTRGRLA
jgi:DNA-binding GntR family transcriptional regulator